MAQPLIQLHPFDVLELLWTLAFQHWCCSVIVDALELDVDEADGEVADSINAVQHLCSRLRRDLKQVLLFTTAEYQVPNCLELSFYLFLVVGVA